MTGSKTGKSLLIEDGILPWIVRNANNEASPIRRRHIELALCHLAQHEINAKDMIKGGALWELVRISRDCSRDDIRTLAYRTLTSSSSFQAELKRLRIEYGLAGVDMVLRNHLDQFIVGKTMFLDRVASPLLAEIIGVSEALTWLKERFSTTKLIVKTDNLLMKQAVEENLVAHCLARASASVFDSMEWDTNPPSLITDVLEFDLNNT
ncbi:Armadillo repeat-containing kinesin-like protein 2 [Capsicum chinense]|nr:Armadillo repeat-containing kinesin-like protein 2 [Capsicum chinense]